MPSRVVCHGQGGIGKTAWAAQAPNPFFLLSPGETGLHTLIDAGLLPPVASLEIDSVSGLVSIIHELATTETEYKTVVMDTVDGFEKVYNRHVRDTVYAGDGGEKGFGGYQRGFMFVANGPWTELLAALDRLRAAKRMGIILLAHTGVGNFKNPDGSDFNRYCPAMAKYAWEVTYGWADMVLFAHRTIVTKKEKGDAKAKGKGGSIRTMFTEYDAIADAKNRHNLPPEIDMGNSPAEAWTNFRAALAEGKNGNTKQEEK